MSNEYCEKRISYFRSRRQTGANIESCYENFNSMPPSSVDPEHVFSGCGKTVTKSRSSLHDLLNYWLVHTLIFEIEETVQTL
jgi:hypothetical protein